MLERTGLCRVDFLNDLPGLLAAGHRYHDGSNVKNKCCHLPGCNSQLNLNIIHIFLLKISLSD